MCINKCDSLKIADEDYYELNDEALDDNNKTTTEGDYMEFYEDIPINSMSQRVWRQIVQVICGYPTWTLYPMMMS